MTDKWLVPSPGRRHIMKLGLLSALVTIALLPSTARAAYVAPAFPNLTFASPIDIEDPRDGTDRLFVVERAGRIYGFANDVSATSKFLFLDIADSVTTQSEGGLLSLAFHPDYASNGYLYVTYTIENPRRTVVARFTRHPGNPNIVNPASELRILELPQVNLYHKGGCLVFGPDGYLYLSLGEDGIAHYAQDLTRFNGKLLRIDVDNPSGGNNYGIPAGNPFVGNANGWLEEIYAYGFRNPWQFSIDVPSGRIWLGDVGQDTYEEIDIVKKGRNYGWPRMEGTLCLSPPSCDTTGLNIDAPLFVYPHALSASVTAGAVYRGSTVPGLAGKFIYSDFITGRIGMLTWNGVNPPLDAEIPHPPGLRWISSFGVDVNDELYFTSFVDGKVYRFFESVTGVARTPPARGALSSVHPNPFEATATVSFTLAQRAQVRLDVFDVRGRAVATLLDRSLDAGDHATDWNGSAAAGGKLPGGIYFVRLTLDGHAAGARRMVLLR